MRTTVDIEDDVLEAAREIARKQHVSAGKVISRLLRTALSGPVPEEGGSCRSVGGFRPFAASGEKIVTNEKVDQLRDEQGI